MVLELSPPASRIEPLAQRIVPDRRRHKRVPLALLGRFMRANKQEYPCKLIDISVGGMALMSPVAVEEGERVVAYLDALGGLEGTVVRQIPGGFALQLHASQHKREKLAAQITWLINRHELGVNDARRHERIVPRNGLSELRLEDGSQHPCHVLDVSISGASVATDERPDVGSEVMLGKLRSKVVRHHEQGIGLSFVDIQQPTALRRYFG